MKYYLDRIEELGADGIDFVPIMFSKEEQLKHIISSYTKEEFKSVKSIPKTSYLFWKMIDGKKKYIESVFCCD